jgi:hypothetical protein
MADFIGSGRNMFSKPMFQPNPQQKTKQVPPLEIPRTRKQPKVSRPTGIAAVEDFLRSNDPSATGNFMDDFTDALGLSEETSYLRAFNQAMGHARASGRGREEKTRSNQLENLKMRLEVAKAKANVLKNEALAQKAETGEAAKGSNYIKIDENGDLTDDIQFLTADQFVERSEAGERFVRAPDYKEPGEEKLGLQKVMLTGSDGKSRSGTFDPNAKTNQYKFTDGTPAPDNYTAYSVSVQGKAEDVLPGLTPSQAGDVTQNIMHGQLINKKLADIRGGIVDSPEAAGYLGKVIETTQGITEQLDVALGTNLRQFVPGGNVTQIRGQIKQLRPMMISYLDSIGRYNKTTQEMIDNLVSAAEDATGPKQALIQIDNLMEQISLETNKYRELLGETPDITEAEYNNLKSGDSYWFDGKRRVKQ